MKRLIAMLTLPILLLIAVPALAQTLTCWFPPEWKNREAQAKTITDALSANSGLTIQPRIAASYPEILAAFSTPQPNLVYVGSFVQSIIAARQLGTPLVQAADGKEMYAGVLVCPKEQNPEVILKQYPREVAFARGASSGESTAKAATGGQAAVPTASHGESVKAVLGGKAKAAVVKDWWWLANEANYAGLKSYRIPGLSEQRNPDHVLTASKAVPKELMEKVTLAALASSGAFGETAVVLPFDGSQLTFSLELMKQGKIDPLTYSW